MKKYDNYVSNLRVFERAGQEDLDNEFIVSGIIDKFSIQFELGWKMLKELVGRILRDYIPQFLKLEAELTGKYKDLLKAI